MRYAPRLYSFLGFAVVEPKPILLRHNPPPRSQFGAPRRCPRTGTARGACSSGPLLPVPVGMTVGLERDEATRARCPRLPLPLRSGATFRMMRGDVTVVSASGNGSMFTLRLPVGVVR